MVIDKAFTLKPTKAFKNAAILQVTSKMHLHMHTLYQCGCGCAKVELAPDSNRFNNVNKAFDKAIEAIHINGGFQAKDLNLKEVKRLTKETFSALKNAVDTGITHVVPPAMRSALQTNVFFFSGLKTYVSLKEASTLLLDGKGSIKPLYQFKQDALAINSKYNINYLEAEHGFAVRSAQMAAKWLQFQKDGDRYDLQYRTANDDKVRPAHRALHNITLPITDPFWLSYWAPLGWRCRCNIVQVRKGKYEVTDSATAMALGETATTIIGADGKNKAEIFRGNSGAQERIFPENHPYAKLTPKAAKEIIEQQAQEGQYVDVSKIIKKEEVTDKDVKEILFQYADKFPEDFRKGLDKVSFKQASYLMQHSMTYRPSTGEWISGSTLNISTKASGSFNASIELKGAFKAIKDKKDLSFNQEYAIEAMWHEILHAKTQSKPQTLTPKQTEAMETINQFCARNTYDAFLNRLGGKATHKEKILEEGIGYKRWVSEFRKRLREKGVSDDDAVQHFMPELLKDYKTLKVKMEEYLKKD